MKRRYRQHVNPLKMTSLVPREAPPVIPAGPEVEVELGCGDARFIIELARSNPDRLYVGLDIRPEFMEFGKEVIAREQLENVSLEFVNLIVDADRLFDPGRIRRFYINFPDPWFKERQRNRRWLSEETLACLVEALQDRGEILFQSDVWTLGLEALALMEASPGLFNTCGEWTFLRQNPFGVASSREIACIEERRSIWRMLFMRDAAIDGDEPYD